MNGLVVSIRLYITYSETLTISLNFWLSWFLNVVSEASVTRDHGFESQPPLIQSEIFSAMYEENMCYIHNSNPKVSRLRDRLDYITISLSF